MSSNESPADQIELSREQFGPNAAKYTTSKPHAKGASLKRLPELVDPQPDWHALDIATGGGHCAFAFAPLVEHVIATDVTDEMLQAAAGVAADREITNISFESADAHDLQYDDDSFQLVTCRIAPHHFADPAKFVREVARVLQPGGRFGLVDNLAPESPADAVWLDDFERRRDPSHLRCLPASEWRQLARDAGLTEIAADTMPKTMNFAGWADNMSVSSEVRLELLEDLSNAPQVCREWLQPSIDPDGDQGATDFLFIEGVFVWEL